MGSCVIRGHPRLTSRIDDAHHALAPGMNVDVPDLDRLAVTSSMAVEGMQQLAMEAKELDRVIAVDVDEILGHVPVALAQKSES